LTEPLINKGRNKGWDKLKFIKVYKMKETSGKIKRKVNFLKTSLKLPYNVPGISL